MFPLSTIRLVSVIFGSVLCNAIPSPNLVGSDIQILLHNDIYGSHACSDHILLANSP